MSDTSGENPMDDGTTAANEQPFALSFVAKFALPGESSERKQKFADMIAAAHKENQARRARVLRYPDLAKMLTQWPIGYARPEDWNGYVPPRTDPELACRDQGCRDGSRPCRHEHMVPANTSPRRRALVEICAEALRRENAQEHAA